jgi:hypothetical protein
VEEVELGLSSMEDCESELGLGYVVQGLYKVGSSSQKVPAVEFRRLGQFDESGDSTDFMVAMPGVHGASRCVSGGVKLSTELSQSLMGGEVMEEATHQEAQISGLVPWHFGDLVMDSVDSSGHVVEVLTPCAKMPFAEYRCVRTEGDGSFSLPL